MKVFTVIHRISIRVLSLNSLMSPNALSFSLSLWRSMVKSTRPSTFALPREVERSGCRGPCHAVTITVTVAIIYASYPHSEINDWFEDMLCGCRYLFIIRKNTKLDLAVAMLKVFGPLRFGVMECVRVRCVTTW